MARKTSAHRARGDAPARDIYAETTARIIAELEQGHLPWVQPWGSVGASAPGLPRNALTGRAYSGVNVLFLWGALFEHGFASQSWLTFRQAIEAGGAVRKGERGTTVVYADRFTPETEKERARATGEDARSVPFLKRFTVFNVAQCEGLRPGLARDPEPLPERQIVPVAEAVIAASGVDFRIGGNRAFYVPSQDYVQVPPQPAFFEQVNYYRTALHELCHNAATRIMPHGLRWRSVFLASAMRLFGIIRALPGTRGADRRAGTGPAAWLGRRHERAPFLLSACRHGWRRGSYRRSRDQARVRSPLDRHRGGAGPSPCCGAAYVA